MVTYGTPGVLRKALRLARDEINEDMVDRFYRGLLTVGEPSVQNIQEALRREGYIVSQQNIAWKGASISISSMAAIFRRDHFDVIVQMIGGKFGMTGRGQQDPIIAAWTIIFKGVPFEGKRARVDFLSRQFTMDFHDDDVYRFLHIDVGI